jgi:hypothetical protein
MTSTSNEVSWVGPVGRLNLHCATLARSRARLELEIVNNYASINNLSPCIVSTRSLPAGSRSSDFNTKPACRQKLMTNKFRLKFIEIRNSDHPSSGEAIARKPAEDCPILFSS